MAEEDFESFDNLDDLDWSDVEDELKANREQIIAEATTEPDAPAGEEAAPAAPAAAAPPINKDALDINFLLDVQLQISVEVGRTRMKILKLLQMSENSIMELNTLVGEPLDIRINDKLVARGEVAIINDKFAVKITDIISPDDRFAAL